MENNFKTTITVNAPAEHVYNAINNVSKWWHGEVKGSTGKLDDEFTYRWQDIHYSKQRVIELVPFEKIVWLVTESSLNFTNDKSEWTGTKLIFEISAAGNNTTVSLTHQGLVPEVECYDACSNGWNMLIQQSLLSFITTGKGKEVF